MKPIQNSHLVFILTVHNSLLLFIKHVMYNHVIFLKNIIFLTGYQQFDSANVFFLHILI